MNPSKNSPGNASTASAADDDVIGRTWDEVDRTWDDPEAHRKLVGLAAAAGRLPEVARRYREVEREHPARAEVARRMLDRILGLAMQDMLLRREPPDERPRRAILGIGYAVALALLAATAYLLLRGRS